MEKKAYCLIEERCKAIKYLSQPGIPDVDSIRQRLNEACKNDNILDMMLRNKLIVLQKEDPDRNNKMCDIESDEVIPDKCEIKVVLIKVPMSDTSLCTGVYSISDGDFFENENNNTDTNVKVIYTEPIMNVSDSQSSVKNNSTTSCAIETLSNDNEKKENKHSPAVKPSSSHETNSKCDVIKCEDLNSRLKFIRNPANLPPLTPFLEEKLKNLGIIAAQRYFIAHWGSYLWNVTNEPSKQDYYNLASSIVCAYPELRGGKNENDIVRSSLSTCIRNHRANMKKSTKRDIEGKPKLPKSKAALVVIEPLQTTESDVKNALKELEKKYTPGKNTSHVKRLLQTTLTQRRVWIENEATRIVDIVLKYPQLKEYDMMIFELLQMKKLGNDVFFRRIQSTIEDLLDIFPIEIRNEKSKTIVLLHLYNELVSRQLKKKFAPLFFVDEVMMSTSNLATDTDEAPRIVIYTSGINIDKSFIVADKDICVNIPEPTCEKILGGLLAAYYVWHRNFPAPYENTLQYIDHTILETPLPRNNNVISKLLRRVHQKNQK